ncbi:F-box protein At4g22390 [Linum perenne]
MQYLNQGSKVKLMGSCNGLLCYLHFNHTHNDLVVLNPSTGERHVVNSFISNEKVAEMVKYGFGYDELSKDYKVVMITLGVAEIYNLRNRDFTGTIHFPVRRTGGSEEKRGVFVHGALHWIIFNRLTLSYALLALDLAMNTFRELPQAKYHFSWGKSIAVVDSCLSVCSFYKEEEEANIVGIYVMKEYGNGESWDKIYSFQDPVPESAVLESVVPVWGNGDRLLLKLDGGRKLVWFDKVEDDMVEAMNPEDGLFDAVYCLESLVKIFPVRDDVDDRVLVRSARRS